MGPQLHSGIPRDAERVVLVDERNRPVGSEEKLRAHQEGGKLHRAFSVFIFDSQGRLMLQRRALGKYHFAGLWTNACCGHPRVDEDVLEAAHRRLMEEMGFDAPLNEAFTLLYREADPVSGLTEHELDHVLLGTYDCDPCPNPHEVSAWRWAQREELTQDLEARPEFYTPWFAIIFRRLVREELCHG